MSPHVRLLVGWSMATTFLQPIIADRLSRITRSTCIIGPLNNKKFENLNLRFRYQIYAINRFCNYKGGCYT